MNRKIILIASVILLVIITIFVIWPRFFAPQKPDFTTAVVEQQNLVKTVSATGKIKAKNSVDLKFQTGGELAWIGVKEGDSVQMGQAIAQLDVISLQKNLQKYLNDYIQNRWTFEESTQTTYRDSVLTNTVRRIIDKQQKDLDNTVLDVEIANHAKDLATLISPISGVVTNIDNPVAGVNVTVANVITIADPTSMIFTAPIDEADIGQVKIGQKTKITLDAYPDEEFNSTISKVDFTSTTTSGGGTAFNIEVKLPENIEQKFKPGMNGDIEITVAEKENVLIVPSQAIDNNQLWILKNNKPEQVNFTDGLKTDTQAEITSGIKKGDLVITTGFDKLKTTQNKGLFQLFGR